MPRNPALKIVMTLMVRDEADILAAMLEHHKAQGVDHVLVTDNGSIDETPAILRGFVDDGFATVWDDPVHRKQQYTTVTKMARYAASHLGADWVINADADEFWVTTDPSQTVRDVLAEVVDATPYLTVPVVNLTGAPAKDGSGLTRLRFRDTRADDELHRSGIPFHPTADAVHRAHAAVEVSQGNHFVTAPGWGDGATSSDLEVLHLPWRSWRQYEHKVRAAGEAYVANPDLTPSPRHHGMQDFRRWQGGRLEAAYVAKHPTPEEVVELLASGSLTEDGRLTVLESPMLTGHRPDIVYTAAESQELAEIGRLMAQLEATADARYLEVRDQLTEAHRVSDRAIGERNSAVADRDRLAAERDHLAALLRSEKDRLVVRVADKIGAVARRVLRRSRS
ncbi:glycosyltransferase family 2 protein [Microbacterium lacus]|uniref:glycosyltransferase family 2 protein n=1 Tax=Microbacterium lacus TaxID=415217 RepID=UPI00384C36B0